MEIHMGLILDLESVVPGMACSRYCCKVPLYRWGLSKSLNWRRGGEWMMFI